MPNKKFSIDRKKTVVFGPSKCIPGQSLYPADLMKRHLAGTLPPIDLSSKYEYHYDEDGNKIADRLPTEMYELHALAVALRKKQYEAAIEHRKQQAIKERERIIAEYQQSLSPNSGIDSEPREDRPVGDGAAAAGKLVDKPTKPKKSGT